MKNPVFLILFLVSTNVFPSTPTDGIDIRHYRFRLELNDTTDVIRGTATVTVHFNKELEKFGLDLAGRSAGGKGMTVSDVNADGKKLAFSHLNNFVEITLEKSAVQGSELAVTISYSGVPEDGLIIGKNKYGDRTFFGDNWPDRAHYWLPVVDHPSDKASVEFIVVAPLRYEVIANGVRKEESIINEQQKLTHWIETVPLPAKVMVIGAAAFAIQYAGEVNDIGIEHWVYPQNREEGFHDFASAARILEFFIDKIGPYPYRKLANVQSKTRFGGMENASNIFYFENAVNGKADHNSLIAHEIAHQWFGNSASEADWHHVWLSEGFATYFTNVYNEFIAGDEARASLMKNDRDQVLEHHRKQPLPVVFTDLPTDLMEILSVNSYQKGSWILHMMRKKIGDANFWKGIRQYYQEYQGRNARTPDLQRIMESVSGQELSIFFRQWLYTPGHPRLRTAWKHDPRTGMLEVAISQTQGGHIFDIPVEIAWYGSGSDPVGSKTVQMDGKNVSFSVKTKEKPSRIALDPGVNLLFEEDRD